jgi:hypothetical protein
MLCLLSILSLPPTASTASNVGAPKQLTSLVRLPVIGCAAECQGRVVKAPRSGTKALSVSVSYANRLCYYKSQSINGILAPKGWHGFETSGSNGANLFLTPKPVDRGRFFQEHVIFKGPFIQCSQSYADTSGKYEVAETIARLFPSQRAFVKDVIDNFGYHANEFPFGPYPNDKITYRGKNVVEFQTPANADGFGNKCSLADKNGEAIYGVVILHLKNNWPESITHLTIRLDPKDADLRTAIMSQFEKDWISRKSY